MARPVINPSELEKNRVIEPGMVYLKSEGYQIAYRLMPFDTPETWLEKIREEEAEEE